MLQTQVFSCEKCGQNFTDTETADAHEKKCLSLVVDQRVKFLFELLPYEGRITGLHPPAALGAKATVNLETDIEIVDVDQLHDGKHVWVTRDNVIEIL